LSVLEKLGAVLLVKQNLSAKAFLCVKAVHNHVDEIDPWTTHTRRAITPDAPKHNNHIFFFFFCYMRSPGRSLISSLRPLMLLLLLLFVLFSFFPLRTTLPALLPCVLGGCGCCLDVKEVEGGVAKGGRLDWWCYF